MFKGFKTIKIYYKMAQIKWIYLLIEFVLLLIPSILSIISPILTAQIISSITVYDYARAVKILSFDFVIILVTAIFYLIYHFCSEKIIKILLKSVYEKIYIMVKNNPQRSNISSAIMNDIWHFSKFNSDLLYKFCFLIKSVVILIIISYYSFLISSIILVVSLISSLLLSFTNRIIQKNSYTLSEDKVKSLELFNNIQKGIKIDGNEKIENSMKLKLNDSIENLSKINSKISLFYNINNNFISLILKSAVFGLTFYLIFLIKGTSLTLPIYLILTPYLTSSAQNLIAFFEILPEIGIIENILKEFNELESKDTNLNKNIKLTKESQNNFDLKIFDVLLNNTKISLEIPFKSIAMLIFDDNEIKNILFNAIVKSQKLPSGGILFGGKNLTNLDKNELSEIIAYTSNTPYFYNTTILENLLAVCKNKIKISKTLNNLNLTNYFKNLPFGINTTIKEDMSKTLLFFIGIVRASLLSPKIFCIYELPSDMTSNEKYIFSQIISFLSRNCTVILFINEIFNNINADIVYFIDK